MFYFLIGIHFALCFMLVILVLMQQGKGAEVGVAFGGGSNTLFGAGGAAEIIIKMTTGAAVAFMVTSILLVRHYNSGSKLLNVGQSSNDNNLQGSVFERVPDAPSNSSSAAIVDDLQSNDQNGVSAVIDPPTGNGNQQAETQAVEK
ncbi:MAG TPA: preprotein translocase subunit SecG [Oligoflexia bacterium]|nr:preprotein translocase subunit SecG [Oligoflexia bacterium]HMP26558.1 preprotein translocase subunit SecG [Oligoflexia bacterium]